MHYLYLTFAILAEVIATSSLKAANEFTNLIPSMLVIIGYVFAFYFLMLSLRNIPLGVAYAIWCGVGITIVALVGVVYYKQMLDLAAMIGIGLIVAGVCTIQLFSHTSTVH
ncbi:MAG: multidrug efflux SMR transporter [Gammaproteobacteria bacterium]|jgi:small multidrug resistance pump|nr:multidrug efflux SMR transporter [Gammaproteobacteria bacterium]